MTTDQNSFIHNTTLDNNSPNGNCGCKSYKP